MDKDLKKRLEEHVKLTQPLSSTMLGAEKVDDAVFCLIQDLPLQPTHKPGAGDFGYGPQPLSMKGRKTVVLDLDETLFQTKVESGWNQVD